VDFGESKERFFEASDRELGNVTEAARAVGVSRNTAFGWTPSRSSDSAQTS
jgi:transcriptional regulator of acetoin/glycerol metabolism